MVYQNAIIGSKKLGEINAIQGDSILSHRYSRPSTRRGSFPFERQLDIAR